MPRYMKPGEYRCTHGYQYPCPSCELVEQAAPGDIEVDGWHDEHGHITNNDGYGIVMTLPSGGYMNIPPEMGRRILKALTD